MLPSSIRDFQTQALHTHSLDELNQLLAKLCELLEFDGFAHGGYLITSASAQPQQFVLTNYPQAWSTRYVSNDYSEIDPIVIYSARNMLASSWDDIVRQPYAQHKPAREFMEEAAAYGLKHGIVLPVRNPGIP